MTWLAHNELGTHVELHNARLERFTEPIEDHGDDCRVLPDQADQYEQ